MMHKQNVKTVSVGGGGVGRRREPGAREAVLLMRYRAAEADEAAAKAASDLAFGAMKERTAVVEALTRSGVSHAELRKRPEWYGYTAASRASFAAEDAYEAAQQRRAEAWAALSKAETELAVAEARRLDREDRERRRNAEAEADREDIAREREADDRAAEAADADYRDIATVLSESGLNAEAVAEAGRLRDMEDAAKAEVRRAEDGARANALRDSANAAEGVYQCAYRAADWAARDGAQAVQKIGVPIVTLMHAADLARAAWASMWASNRAGIASHQSPKAAAVRAVREWGTLNKFHVSVADAQRFVALLGLGDE